MLSGKIVETFGDNGAIDLEKDVDRDLVHGESIVATTPGGIYQDLLILATRDDEGPRPAAPGHIRAYDAPAQASAAGSSTRSPIQANSATTRGLRNPGRPPAAPIGEA